MSIAAHDLKQRTIRGGFAKLCSQGTNFALRIGSLMILSRMLDPGDFGLVGMVMAFTGVLDLFKDFGLSSATVQRGNITNEQHSTLFWINLLVGAALAVLTASSAPLVVRFYHEPRLFALTIVLAVSFLINAAGVQHDALLQRQLRFTALAGIEMIALAAGVAVAIGMALRGFGYWALVATTIVPTVVATGSFWLATGWIPGLPRRAVGLRSLLRFGGTVTLNGFVVYLAYNLEKVLLGRFWGAAALGLYGRAYQLVNIPTANLNSAAGVVAFSALSRLQDDRERLKNYFLKGYSLLLALTVPVTILCAIFAADLIAILLGPKWTDATTVFRLLAPTILIFALINPLGWLMFASGLIGRSLKVALVLTPIVITGYAIGLRYGPTGVAFGYSAMMGLWVVPHIAWCIHGTGVGLRDILEALSGPFLSGIAASVLPLAFQLSVGTLWNPLPRLLIGGVLFVAVYAAMLLGVMGQKSFYLGLLRGFRGRSSVPGDVLASA